MSKKLFQPQNLISRRSESYSNNYEFTSKSIFMLVHYFSIHFKENKVNTSNPVEAITQFLESFRTFTVVGNLTTYIINISISLIVELNELMLSDRHHKLQVN